MNPCIVMLIIVWFCLNFKQYHTYEYCTKSEDEEKPLCRDPYVHVVCDPDQVPRAGEVVGVVPMTSKLRKHFLHVHNAYRNNTACGSMEVEGKGRYTKATKMRLLIWDDELAFIATVHAKQCNMVHDKCRNTRRFPKSGQNLGYSESSYRDTILHVTETAVQYWFEEYKNVTDIPGFAALYPKEQKLEVGHFTQLANDRVSRVGCGVTLCSREEDNHYYYHTTCNYDFTNIQGAEVYDDKGDMGSKCSDWGTELSDDYECLCENSGEIFEN